MTVLFLTSLVCSCSTPQKSRLSAMGLAFPAGVVLGASTAPVGEKRELHGLFWGSLLMAGAALVGNFTFSEEAQLRALREENQTLKTQLEQKFVLTSEGTGHFKSPFSKKKNQKPAQWKVYKVDQWIKDGSTRMYHRDQMIEIIPITESP